MKIGITVGQVGHLAVPAAFDAMAAAAESLGYASLWLRDLRPPALDAVDGLLRLADLTARPRLGVRLASHRRAVGLLDQLVARRPATPLDRFVVAGEAGDVPADRSHRTGGPGVLVAGSGAVTDTVVSHVDGWLAEGLDAPEIERRWGVLRRQAVAGGRDPARLRLVVRVVLDPGSEPAGPRRGRDRTDEVIGEMRVLGQIGVDEVVLAVRGDPSLDAALWAYAEVATDFVS